MFNYDAAHLATKFDDLEFFANQVFFLCEERGLIFNLLSETLTYNFFKVGTTIASSGFCLDDEVLLKTVRYV